MVIAHVRTSRTSKLRWNHRHVVRRGDSLWTIAKQYNTTTQKIQEVNHLRTTMLSIHQVLKVPSRAHASARHSGGASSTYYVQRGDSPYVIAQKYNITLNHFLEINNLTAQSTIYPGQSVKIE
jgi:membrane-bound lytic murein transglycosylase D